MSTKDKDNSSPQAGENPPREKDLLELLASQTPPEQEEKSLFRRFMRFLKVNLIAGLVVLAPLVITLWLFKNIVVAVDNRLIGLVPQKYRLNNLIEAVFGVQPGFDIHGLGLLAGIVFLVMAGLLVRNIFGKTLLAWGEAVVNTIPGVRSVYHAIKQITETVASSNSKSFRKVVMLQYPRKGIWSIGFVSGTTKGQVQAETDKKLVNVFLPTTPNPTSGFLLFVPEKDLIELDMTVDQGLKMIISAGIVTPTKTEGKKALREKNAEAGSQTPSA